MALLSLDTNESFVPISNKSNDHSQIILPSNKRPLDSSTTSEQILTKRRLQKSMPSKKD